MHGASAATTEDAGGVSRRLKNWYSRPGALLSLMRLCSVTQQAPGYQSRASMIWMAGHLLHGSGFTAQVLAAVKSLGLERPIFRSRIGYGSRFIICGENYGTGRPEPTNKDDSPSIWAQQNGPLWYSPTYPSMSERDKWKSYLFMDRYGSVPSSLKTR